MARFEIRMRRAPMAVVVGALVGAIAGLFLLALSEPATLPPSAAVMALVMIGAGFIFFLFGIAIFGLPAWMLLHVWGFRGWLSAALLGGIECFAAMLLIEVWPMWSSNTFSSSAGGHDLIVNNHITAYGWKQALTYAGLLAIAGVLAGLSVWRFAYIRVDGD